MSVSFKPFLPALAATALCAAGARASCGSSVCPLETLNTESRSRGFFRLAYEFEYIDQDQPRVGTRRAEVGEIPGHHDEVYTVNRMHRVTASYGFTDRLSADLAVPFVSRSHEHIHDHGGQDIADRWSFDGLGDLGVSARYAVLSPARGPVLSLVAAMELPTGSTAEENEDGEHAEPGITPGSGSTDWGAGIGLHQALKARTLSGASAEAPVFLTTYYRWNGKGEEDYRIGDVWQINAGLTYPLASRLAGLAQVNVQVKGRDGRGNTHEEVEKTGGEYVYLTPGLRWRVTERVYVSGLIQLPVYQRVNQIQLTSDYNALLSVFYQVGG